MIRATNPDKIRTSGDFKVDGLWVQRFELENIASNSSKQKLTITMIPFSYLDDGSKIYDHEKPVKCYLNDAESYLLSNVGSNFFNAYFATEQAIADLMNEQHPEYQCVFQAPQGV